MTNEQWLKCDRGARFRAQKLGQLRQPRPGDLLEGALQALAQLGDLLVATRERVEQIVGGSLPGSRPRAACAPPRAPPPRRALGSAQLPARTCQEGAT